MSIFRFQTNDISPDSSPSDVQKKYVPFVYYNCEFVCNKKTCVGFIPSFYIGYHIIGMTLAVHMQESKSFFL